MTRAHGFATLLPALCGGLLAVCATVTPLPANAQRISLQQAVEDALENSPEVLIARERVHQAREGVMETRGELLPQVDASVSSGREFNTPAGARDKNRETRGDYTTSYDATFGASQKLFDGAQTKSEIRRREELLEGSNYRASAIRHRVAQQMVETFLNIYQNQQALASVNIFVGRLEDLSAKMDLYAEEGNASKTLQKYVSSRLANAKQVRVQIDNSLQDAVETYTFLTQAPLELSRTTLVLMRLPALESFESYQEATRTNNPDMKASQADLDAAKAEYEKAKGLFMPTVSLNGEYSDNRNIGGKVGQVRGASAMLEMRYKVFDGFSRDATVRRMVSQQTEKELQMERTRRKNDQSLKTAWQTLSAKLEEEKLIREELADTMDVRNLRQQEFEEGAGDLVQLVETEEKLFAAARQKLNVDTAILLNRFTLEFLSGRPHLSGSEEYLPFNPFDRLKSYSELLERKAQVAPAVATTGNVSDTVITPETMPVPETEEVSTSAVLLPVAEATQDAPVLDKVEAPEVVEAEATDAAVESAEQAPAKKADKTEKTDAVADKPVEETVETTEPVAENVEMEPVAEQMPELAPMEESVKAPTVKEVTEQMDAMLDQMQEIEPAAGPERIMGQDHDVPLEERESLFPDIYLPRQDQSALVLPNDFDSLPVPAGRN